MSVWRKLLGMLVCMGLLYLPACEPELTDDPIPVIPFPDFPVDLSQPLYVNLLSTQNYIELNDLGVRGIILYKEDPSTFHAFERNCSFEPNSACATVEVDASGLFMIDYCCGSTFQFDGQPSGGPAWRPLREYYSYLNGTNLTITDEIIQGP